MAALKNARHERFAQELAKGKSASEAYRVAGYKPDDGNAIRLTGNDKVKARLAELSERIAEKAEWTAADRLASLKTIHDAQAKADPRVAIAAIAEANKMQGSHAPAKTEVSEPGGWEQAEDKTWRQRLRGEKK